MAIFFCFERNMNSPQPAFGFRRAAGDFDIFHVEPGFGKFRTGFEILYVLLPLTLKLKIERRIVSAPQIKQDKGREANRETEGN